MHFLGKATAMILSIGAEIQRIMIHYYNNLPHRINGKGRAGGGMGIGNILYKQSQKASQRPRYLKKELKEVRKPTIRMSVKRAIWAGGTAHTKVLREVLAWLGRLALSELGQQRRRVTASVKMFQIMKVRRKEVFVADSNHILLYTADI